MAGIEINLLQFVALALPAIAILMQAIIMFHQQHSDESTDRIFWTEFRIIEIAFFLMTIGGAVFGIAIFNTATSLITKAGIVLVIGSLILLAPATWFALGRAKYPTTHFESPEEVVSYGVKTMAFILPIIIILLVISFVPRISDSISNLASIDVPLFQSITLAVSLGAIIITFLTTLEKYYSYRYSSEKTHEWVSDIEEIISSLNSVIDENEELLTTLEIKSESEFRTVRNELREDLRRLSTQLENAPPRVENTAQDVVDRISFIEQRGNELLNLIEETHQLAHSAESRRESLDDVESRLEKVTNEISSVENELDQKYTQRERSTKTNLRSLMTLKTE